MSSARSRDMKLLIRSCARAACGKMTSFLKHDVYSNYMYTYVVPHAQFITQYGSTVYIGMAMGCSAL